MIPTDQLYHQYSRLIAKKVYAYSSRWPGVESQDLMCQAGLIFCKACETYDPGLGAFSTHLTAQLGRLQHYVERSSRWWRLGEHPQCTDAGETLDPLAKIGTAPDQKLWDDFCQGVRGDAKTILDWYHQAALDPSEKSTAAKCLHLTAWSVYMRKAKQMGWSWKRSEAAFLALRQRLASYRDGFDFDQMITALS